MTTDTHQKHTPLPWKVYYAKNNGQLVLGTGEENGQAIQNHNGSFWRDDAEAKANCEFVVKACNAHYELLEALELADAALSGSNMNMNVVQKKVKAALAKARG